MNPPAKWLDDERLAERAMCAAMAPGLPGCVCGHGGTCFAAAFRGPARAAVAALRAHHRLIGSPGPGAAP